MLKAKVKFPYEQLFATPTAAAVASLVVSLVALSFSPILIRLSQGELGPNATIFNRFWISTVAFVLWTLCCGMDSQTRGCDYLIANRKNYNFTQSG